MKRFLLISLLVVLVLIVGAALYIRNYLQSPQIAQEVASRLETLYGGPVRVASVEVGLGGSTVRDFELFEPTTVPGRPEAGTAKPGTPKPATDASAASSAAEPWLKVGTLKTDMSLWDIVRGMMPRHVTISGARVTLRFDAAGALVTHFPSQAESTSDLSRLKQLPDVVIEQSEVVLRKFGQPELVAREVSARLSRAADGNFILAGTAQNAELGKLVLDGTANGSSGAATATLKTAKPAHLTQALLERVPFIPAVTWQELQIAEGDSPAALTVHYDLKRGPLHYRLDLAPTHTAVRVPLLDLAAHDAHGDLAIDDNLVQLRHVHGKAYGGEVKLDADLDFRTHPTKFHVPEITLTKLNVSELPESWEIPATVRKLFAKGTLSGTVSVHATMGYAAPSPIAVNELVGITTASTGTGRWLPAVALLAAFPRPELHVQSQGKATITDVSGGTAEIELKLGPRHARPQPPAKSSAGPAPAEAALLAAFAGSAVALEPGGGQAGYPEINARLGRAVSEMLGGVHSLLNEIVGVGERFVGKVPKKVEPAPARTTAAPNYLDLNLKLNNVDLAQLVKSLGLKLDFPVEGRVSFQVKASIPTDRAGDIKAYKAQGSAQVTGLRVAGVPMESLDTEVNYAAGILELTALKGRFAAAQGPDVAAGTVQGHGQMQVVPLGDVSADLTLDRIPASAVARLAADTGSIDGSFSGRLHLRGPVAKLKSFDALTGDGKIGADRLTVYGFTLEQLATAVQLKDGLVRVSDLVGRFEGTPVTASAELRLGDRFPFKAKAKLKNWDLATLQKLAAKGKEPPIVLAGSFTTTLDLNGTLSPFKATVAGDASARKLKVNALQIDDVGFHWATNTRTFDLTNIDLRLYGGLATGSAALPLAPDAAGAVNLKLTQLDAKQLVKDLALPVKIEGRLDGAIKGTLPPAAQGAARTASLDIDVTAPKLRVQNIPTEQLHGKLDYKNGVIDYKLEGKTLGGTFDVEGQIPSTSPVKKESKRGRLRIENVAISRLMEAWRLQDAVPIAGRLSVELDYTHDTPDREPEGTGRLRIANLRWQETLLATDLVGDLILADGWVRLRELSGEIASGIARLQLTYDLHHPERGRFSLALEDVEAAQLLGPFLGDKIKGTLQARVRGRFGGSWRGTADFELTRGEVYTMEVSQWRLPADWHYSPETGRVQIDVHETTAQVARGRATGKLSATWDYTWRLDGNVRFTGVDLQTLIKPFAGSTQVAAGQVTARLDFSGTEMRSINDLRGTLVASFSQAQALQVPVLQQITPYIGMGPSTTFQRGDLQARIDRGVLRVQRLALVGGNFQLYGDGTVGLDAAGRLNLNVIAKAGDVGLPTVRLGVLGLRIPIAGPVPLTVIQEVSNLLANRAIYLEVTGTVHNPVVRIRPLPLLSEEAVRFFLNRANLPIPLAP